ncbi:MAG TPA: OmpA family protein [Candidatus Acidoferrales bacterium]|nr:OmpA family protein [Candidatus Acidoferrales bacterium]
MRILSVKTIWGVLGMAALLTAAAYAQEPKSGKLKMEVFPKEAYVFVDGEAKGPGTRSIRVPPGMHTVLVANYGYKFSQQEVSVEPDATVLLNVKLEPSGGAVFGPRGRIQIESGALDADNSAVLLNGKTPDYFVGHVDEFNHDIFWHQELIVPPGSHQVTVTRFGKEVWTGRISVAANERIIIYMSNHEMRVKNWPRGTQLGELKRFKAGIVSTTVAVAPVAGAISANPEKIDCGQSSQLKWNSAEAIDADISGMSPVPLIGERSVSPKHTTTYNFTATGPGGVANSSATIMVNPVVNASINASPAEVRYRRIGDKVIEQNSATLNWSTSNADTISLTPFGIVENSGSKSLAIVPTQSANGRVDETLNYALHASNVCGGSEVKTASVHLGGSIEPIPEVLLHSIFFPTDYPTKLDPSLGLLRSQHEALITLARGFTKYLEYDPEANLTLAAYADERGPGEYNQSLSERRAQRVKDFLVSQGIAADKISFTAYGEDKPLDKTTVLDLQTQNPEQPAIEHARNFRATWLAYNRRVDVVLLPTNRESLRFYPHSAPDSEILWQTAKPERTVIDENQ